MKNSVRQFFALALLLIGLWLIWRGAWQLIGVYFYLASFHRMGLTTSMPMQAMIVGLHVLPTVAGLLLFHHHRLMVDWCCRSVAPEERDAITWDDVKTLSSLTAGLWGWLFLAVGIDRLPKNQTVIGWILSIDNPPIRVQAIHNNDAVYSSLISAMEVAYPLFIGVVLLLGAVKLGNLMGTCIERTLDTVTEAEGGAE